MRRCTHPSTVLRWHPRDEVFTCQRCGTTIFPTPQPQPDEGEHFIDDDNMLCWNCGGTGRDELYAECGVCQGEGYLKNEDTE